MKNAFCKLFLAFGLSFSLMTSPVTAPLSNVHAASIEASADGVLLSQTENNVYYNREVFVDYELGDGDEACYRRFSTQAEYEHYIPCTAMGAGLGYEFNEETEVRILERGGYILESGSYLSEDGYYACLIKKADGQNILHRFMIDTTKPSVSGVLDDSGITIFAYDDNLDYAIINGEQYGAYNKYDISYNDNWGYFTITGTYSYEDANGTLKTKQRELNFIRQLDSVEFTAVDKAGNTDSVSFMPDKEAPVISGVEDNGCYSTPQIVEITDKALGVIVCERNSSKSVNVLTSASSWSTFIEKDGDYIISALDMSGNNTSVAFCIDTKAPKVSLSGKKSGKAYTGSVKIKFSDKMSGVSKATLDGKNVSSGQTVSRKGSHTLKVTDLAGNTTVLKFKIK